MKEEAKTLSVIERYTIRYIINGFLWFMYSIFNLLPNRSAHIISAILLLISALCSFYIIFAKQQADDEMSLQHIGAAKNLCFEILLLAMIIVGIVSIFIPFLFSLVYGFFVAGSQILTGIIFLKYEKEGC